MSDVEKFVIWSWNFLLKVDDGSSSTQASATTTTARSAPVGHGYSQLIIEKLRDEDFVMETPSAAIFTLIVGELELWTDNIGTL